jgi:hypothetical protein
MPKQIPPIGSHVAFRGHPQVVIIENDVPMVCAPDCDIPHESDHFEQPYVWVRQETRMWLPLADLDMVFDPRTHVGKEIKDA